MAKQVSQTIIYLIRNDLRLHDNECFHYISNLAKRHNVIGGKRSDCPIHLIPLYCFEPEHYINGTYHFNFPRVNGPRAQFLLDSIKDLKKKLQSKGSDLVIRSCFSEDRKAANITVAVMNLIQQLGINTKDQTQSRCTLVFHQEATQEELDTESSLMQICKKYGINVERFWGSTLYHRDDLPFRNLGKNGCVIPDAPDIYTSFRKVVESKSKVRPPFPTPELLPPLPNGIKSDAMPTSAEIFKACDWSTNEFSDTAKISAFPFKGGETEGVDRLHQYLWGTDAIATYKETRNGMVGTEYSTKFSPWLANGSISPRYIFSEVKRYEATRTSNISTYWVIFELIWRDFFRFVCLKHPSKVFHSGGIKGENIHWKRDARLFDKWKKGNTGVPYVDANMRELLKTGWMSNRGRQNVASFLLKDLNLDWRLGAEWFESMLLDHDVCSNYGNWNYAAGIGNDPRSTRKFNVIKQGLDYDPEGEFIKLWIPEIADLAAVSSPTKGKIHFPWRLTPNQLSKAGIELDTTYPRPIVIAGEWNRHYNKVVNKSGGPSKNPSREQKRGIDFYFQPATVVNKNKY